MNKIIENLILCIAIITVFAGLPSLAFAQNVPPRPEAPIRPASRIRSATHLFKTSEKFVKVDGSVNVSFGCISEGRVKVNGWNRNEVRVFVEGGNPFSFKVLQKSIKTGEPVWIQVIGVNENNKFRSSGECITGGEIEIDVPRNATVNIKGREITTIIDSIKKAVVETIGGDIALRKVADGVIASAGRGDITVEESGGAIMLDSTTGNILVFDVGPSDIGDTFKATTQSGTITLQTLKHRQIDIKSISGSVAFSSEILTGASYRLGTSKGSIRLTLPADSSSRISAIYGYGSFSSEIPFKIETENISEGPIKSVFGTIGKGGDAILKLTSSNGSISIKKQ